MKFAFKLLWLGLVLITCRQTESTVDPVPVSPAGTFTNPLLNSGPDPWVVRQGDWYYYCHTVGDRVQLWKVKNLTDLSETEPKTVWKPADGLPYSRNVWAPELHLLDGKWYLYVTAGAGDVSTQRLWVLENASADPTEGEWTFKGQLTTADNRYAIDANVFEFGGKRYAVWSGWEGSENVAQNLYIARMSNPWTLEGPRVLIAKPEYDWERQGAPPAVDEGPEALQHAGRLFMVFSASGCWSDDYALGLLTLTDNGDPLNPNAWKKTPQPVFTKAPDARAFGPGHCSFFRSPDGKEDWILYHANPLSGQGCGNNRSPRMQKFTWGPDGTPQFGRPVKTGEPLPLPSGS
ncbi:glycoside hydrolase family 43 protein [Larkinella soli]|uniref:glycoside hydrolase family 43 protein n=1 Tax=Larkinella soli TaxID=1770527 RepID=UPI000FFB204E|nr:glycoside hydrolase family 43 protein [Larkinella soli]